VSGCCRGARRRRGPVCRGRRRLRPRRPCSFLSLVRIVLVRRVRAWRTAAASRSGTPLSRLSTALTEVSLTSITSALTCPDGGLFVVISCLVHDVVQGGDDARASGGGPWLGDPIVDGPGGRRRAGRPGRPVPGLSHRHRPVAEHGEGVLPRSQGLLGVHYLPESGLARGPAGGRRRVRRVAATAPGGTVGRGRGAAVRDGPRRCLDGEPQARGRQRVLCPPGPQRC
jgi:hypothetical protein